MLFISQILESSGAISLQHARPFVAHNNQFLPRPGRPALPLWRGMPRMLGISHSEKLNHIQLFMYISIKDLHFIAVDEICAAKKSCSVLVKHVFYINVYV